MAFSPQHILVPVAIDPDDDIALAEHAVVAACDIAEKFNCKLTLLHLAHLITPGQPASFDVTGQVLDSFMNVIKARFDFGRSKLEELQEEARARGITVEGRVIDSVESTAITIVNTASELLCDLIIISSHGRRGLSKVLFGGTAAKVTEIAPMPVLVLHPLQTPKAKTK